jgi:hypothetical protein
MADEHEVVDELEDEDAAKLDPEAEARRVAAWATRS